MKYIILSAVGFGFFIFAAAAVMSFILSDIFNEDAFNFEDEDED